MRKVRFGVIGLGYLGQHHARLLSEMEGVSLEAVVDVDLGRAQEIARRTGARAYNDFRDVSGKVDAVTVVTPTRTHFDVTRTFLENGKDVLVEKPITHDLSEAEELVRLAAAQNVILSVGHLERFNAGVTKLQEIVDRPYYIECQRLAPFTRRSTDIDVVLDLMIHDLDIILSIAGSPVRSVRAIGHPVLTRTVDMASAWIEFESGCVANVTASRVSKDKVRKIRVFQRETYVSLDYASQQLTALRRILPQDAGGQATLVEEKVELKKAEPLRAELEEFVESISRRIEPRVTGLHGTEALRLALKVSECMEPRIRALDPLSPSFQSPFFPSRAD